MDGGRGDYTDLTQLGTERYSRAEKPYKGTGTKAGPNFTVSNVVKKVWKSKNSPFKKDGIFLTFFVGNSTSMWFFKFDVNFVGLSKSPIYCFSLFFPIMKLPGPIHLLSLKKFQTSSSSLSDSSDDSSFLRPPPRPLRVTRWFFRLRVDRVGKSENSENKPLHLKIVRKLSFNSTSYRRISAW